MSEKYKHSYRGYLIDHHSPDPPVVTLENLDPDEWERFFEEANINHLMLYCKDHWGSSYYNTKIGRKHPGLKDKDWVGTIVPILKKHGIEFNAYYCFEYDTYAPKAHPEWAVRRKDGQPLKCGMPANTSNAKWGMPCYETGYREYILGQIREIVENYHPDSLFIDIFGRALCYCDTCKELYRKEFGYEMPEDDEEMMAKNRDLERFLNEGAERMLDDLRSTIRQIDPELALTINFAAHYPRQIRNKLDYLFTEPWAGNWLSGAYARDTSAGKYPQLGPGDVSHVYNYQPDSIYRLAAAEIAAQGCRVFMYSEPMHRDGTLEFEEARKVGAAFRDVEKFETYLEDNRLVADIAIVQSDVADTLYVEHPILASSISRAKVSGAHREALLGAMKLCDYSKRTWRVVPELELSYDRMKEFRMILIPNLFWVNPDLKADLKRYAEDGGTVLVSGETGLCDDQGNALEDFALAELSGCHFTAKDETYKKNHWCAYIRPEEEPVWKRSPKTTPPVGEYVLKTRADGAKVLGTFLEPAVLLTDTTWVNWGNPLPGRDTGLPALYENNYGKGRVLTACFDLFTMINKDFLWVKDFFAGIAETYFVPRISLQTDLMNSLEFTCYEREEGRELLVHELSALARLTGGDTPLIDGGRLMVNRDYMQVSKAEMVYPEHKQVPVTYHEESGLSEIALDPLRIHAVYRIVG